MFFPDKNPGQYGDDFPAAFHLLSRFIENAVEKFEFAGHHPVRSPPDAAAGGKVKNGAHGYHNSPLKMGHSLFMNTSCLGAPSEIQIMSGRYSLSAPQWRRNQTHPQRRKAIPQKACIPRGDPPAPGSGRRASSVSRVPPRNIILYFFIAMTSWKIWAPQYWGLSACSSHFR